MLEKIILNVNFLLENQTHRTYEENFSANCNKGTKANKNKADLKFVRTKDKFQPQRVLHGCFQRYVHRRE